MILLFAATSGAGAQLSARQADPDPTQFHSPMIIEMPLPTADRARWGKGEFRSKDIVALKKYVCDGIFIQGLRGNGDGH